MTSDRSARSDADAAEKENTSPLEPVPDGAGAAAGATQPRRPQPARRRSPSGSGSAQLILLTLYLWKPAFLAVVGAAVVIAVWELTNALHADRVRVPVVPVVVGALAILGAAYAGGSEPMLVALTLTILATLLWRLPENPDGYVRDITAGVFVTMYVPLPRGFRGAPAARRRRRGPGGRLHRPHRAQRRRRVRRRSALRTAPDGPDGQPEEVLGGLRGLGALHRRRRGTARDPAGRRAGLGGRR